jgi:hypothetical protein
VRGGAASVKDGPPGVNIRPRHFCWRGLLSPLTFLPVSSSRENSATRRLLAEVNHPQFSLFDDSGTRERQSALTGRIAEYAIITLVVIVIAGMEVGRWAFNTPPQPALFSFVALCLAVYAALRVAFIWRQVAVLRREQQARQNLRLAIDDVCARGWLFFDGLTDPRGHLLGSVLAGPGGLFTLVPRFIARGRNLSEKVRRTDTDMLMIGSHQILANPIGQARRAAHSLYEVLSAEGIDTVAVQPAVVIPGWTIESSPGEAEEEEEPDVWILSDRDLVPRLTQAPAVMEAKDLIAVSLLFERLARR